MLGYPDLQKQFHGTHQVSNDFFLLKSYLRDSLRPQVDSNRAANIHGDLSPINERQKYTVHFLNSSQTLSLIMRDSSALRQPPGSHFSAAPAERPGASQGRARHRIIVRRTRRHRLPRGPRPPPARTPRIPLPVAQSPTAKMATGAESARPPTGGSEATGRG